MKIYITILVLLIPFLESCSKMEELAFDFYCPNPYYFSSNSMHSISIPVKVEVINGVRSFVEVMKLYGFSGNGPSIEQVIRKNITLPAEYDSEGEACVIYFKSRSQMSEFSNTLVNISNQSIFHSWVYNSRGVLIKE